MKEVRKNLFNYTQHCNYKIEERVVYRLEALACFKKKSFNVLLMKNLDDVNYILSSSNRLFILSKNIIVRESRD